MLLRYYFIIGVISTLVLGSCVSVRKELSKYDQYKDKTLVYKQKLKGSTKTDKYLLREYLAQDANRSFVLTNNKAYLKAYLLGRREKYFIFKPYRPEHVREKITKTQNKFDQKIEKTDKEQRKERLGQKRDKKLFKLREKLKEGNWLMRVVGEKPIVYDSAAQTTSVKQLNAILKSKGYFENEVTATVKHKKHKTKITYHIKENQAHKIAEFKYTINDPEVEQILNKAIDKSLVKEGDRYDESILTRERDRINRLLKDNGYFKFARKYIIFKIDTVDKDHEADINILITNPAIDRRHTKYTINNVNFTIDGNKPGMLQTERYNDILYKYHDKHLPRKSLDQFIKIRSGELYSVGKAEKTQQILGSKDIYKFINISYQEIDSTRLDVFLNANSLHKYQFTTEVGANVNLTEGQSLPGPFFSVSLKDRKIFSGMEILEANVRYAYEQQPTITAETENLRSIELGTNLSLTFPTVLIPTKLRYKFNEFASKTVMSIGYTKSDRIEYNRDNLEFVFNYKWVTKRYHYYAVSPLTLSIVNTRNIIDEFQDYLDDLEAEGNNLKESFEPSIISGINFSYIYNDNDLTRNIKAKFFKLFVESGGLLANAISSVDPESDSQAGTVAGLPYYQFYKFQADHRRYYPISKFSSIATRITAGYAAPFGNSEVLPYDKFFFSGGLNSVRAWPLKRLGPGEFVYRDGDGEASYRFEQPGEIYFEYNLEVRSKIIGFLNGALFLDAGNIWTIREDPARPGAEFLFDKFYKQIAVGTGAGIRLDFSFLIFRFDLGMKLWDPGRKIIVPFGDKNKFVFNFGIGYSF